MTAPELMSLDQALEHLLARVPAPGQPEKVPLSQGIGRIIAEDIRVPADVPPADNSAVDGYAIRLADLDPEQRLPVSARIPAGVAPGTLEPGTAARIFTGAEIPEGADTVIMQEQTEREGHLLRIRSRPEAGQNIRRQGQDLVAGDCALERGTLIRPQELGLLASMGYAEVAAYPRLRVAVLATGDELVEPGNPLGPGQIYNTNSYTLAGLLARTGCELVMCETLRDTREATRDSLLQAASLADLVITSGGVSVGEEDHVRTVLEETGELSLWRLAIKPGKPLAFGQADGTPVLGLPGNPAAVLVTFLMVGLPFLKACQGDRQYRPAGEQLPAGFSAPRASVRREFIRARKEQRDGTTIITAFPNQSSGMLSSACWADGLAVVPEHTTISEGDTVTYYAFSELLE